MRVVACVGEAGVRAGALSALRHIAETMVSYCNFIITDSARDAAAAVADARFPCNVLIADAADRACMDVAKQLRGFEGGGTSTLPSSFLAIGKMRYCVSFLCGRRSICLMMRLMY